MHKGLIFFCILSAFLPGQDLEVAELELEREELVLPYWEDDDLAALESGEFVPGSSLLGNIALAFLVSDNEDPIELDPAVRNLPDTELEEPDTEEWATRVAEPFLATYFHEMPRGFLNDPQQLLTTQEFRDREGFLNFHARDTDIDLYIYLFDALQEIPPSESIEEVVRTQLAHDKPVAVVFYFLGKPEKSQLAFSEKVTSSVNQAERVKVLRMAMEEALEKSDPSSQLESFSIQLSIRLYWLEKVVAKGGGPHSAMTPLIFPKAQVVSSEDDGRWAKLRKKPALYYTIIILCVAIPVLLLGWLGRWFSDRRRVYVFPDAEGNVLLAAPHAPGVGAVISFASVSESPSSQKSEDPSYLQKT